MMKKIAAVIAACALAFMIAPPAPASAAWSSCGNYPETVCLFAHSNWGEPLWRQTPEQVDYCRSLVGTGWNNVTTMASNNTAGGYILEVWSESNCTGSVQSITSGTYADFTNTWWNDRISAVRVIAL